MPNSSPADTGPKFDPELLLWATAGSSGTTGYVCQSRRCTLENWCSMGG